MWLLSVSSDHQRWEISVNRVNEMDWFLSFLDWEFVFDHILSSRSWLLLETNGKIVCGWVDMLCWLNLVSSRIETLARYICRAKVFNKKSSHQILYGPKLDLSWKFCEELSWKLYFWWNLSWTILLNWSCSRFPWTGKKCTCVFQTNKTIIIPHLLLKQCIIDWNLSVVTQMRAVKKTEMLAISCLPFQLPCLIPTLKSM